MMYMKLTVANCVYSVYCSFYRSHGWAGVCDGGTPWTLLSTTSHKSSPAVPHPHGYVFLPDAVWSSAAQCGAVRRGAHPFRLLLTLVEITMAEKASTPFFQNH